MVIYDQSFFLNLMTIDNHRCPLISHYSLLFIKLSTDDMMKLGPPFSWPPLQLSQEFLLGLCFILWYCLKSEAWKGIVWFLFTGCKNMMVSCLLIPTNRWQDLDLARSYDSSDFWSRLTTRLVIGKRLTQSGAKRCRVALDMGHLAQTLMDRELSIKKTAMDKDHIDVGHFGYWSIWIIPCWIPNFDEIHCDIGIANEKHLGLWVNFITTSPFSRTLEWWLWSVFSRQIIPSLTQMYCISIKVQLVARYQLSGEGFWMCREKLVSIIEPWMCIHWLYSMWVCLKIVYP